MRWLSSITTMRSIHVSKRGGGRQARRFMPPFLEIFDRTPDLHTATVTLVGDGDQVALEMIATGKTVKPHPQHTRLQTGSGANREPRCPLVRVFVTAKSSRTGRTSICL